MIHDISSGVARTNIFVKQNKLNQLTRNSISWATVCWCILWTSFGFIRNLSSKPTRADFHALLCFDLEGSFELKLLLLNWEKKLFSIPRSVLLWLMPIKIQRHFQRIMAFDSFDELLPTNLGMRGKLRRILSPMLIELSLSITSACWISNLRSSSWF